MKTRKTFTQYSNTENGFRVNISVVIYPNGNFRNHSLITFINNKEKNKLKTFTQFSTNEDNLIISIRLRVTPNCNIQSSIIQQRTIKHEREYVKNNTESIKRKNKKHYLKNKNNLIKNIKKYKKEHPEMIETQRAKRRGWNKPILLNKRFKGCIIHHTHRNNNHQECICIPSELHTSIWHSNKIPETMSKINKFTFEWLATQEII